MYSGLEPLIMNSTATSFISHGSTYNCSPFFFFMIVKSPATIKSVCALVLCSQSPGVSVQRHRTSTIKSPYLTTPLYHYPGSFFPDLCESEQLAYCISHIKKFELTIITIVDCMSELEGIFCCSLDISSQIHSCLISFSPDSLLHAPQL